MTKYYIIIEKIEENFSHIIHDKLICSTNGLAITFNNIIDAKDYIFNANIKSAIIFERASILINTQGFDPTKNDLKK